jgi:hypothetical protein
VYLRRRSVVHGRQKQEAGRQAGGKYRRRMRRLAGRYIETAESTYAASQVQNRQKNRPTSTTRTK